MASSELAQSKSFIEDKEAGLNSEVAQGGTNFRRSKTTFGQACLGS